MRDTTTLKVRRTIHRMREDQDGSARRNAEGHMTQLRVGDRVRFRGEAWCVIMVNSCRALIRPESKRSVALVRPNGDAVEFKANRAGISISPFSELERI